MNCNYLNGNFTFGCKHYSASFQLRDHKIIVEVHIVGVREGRIYLPGVWVEEGYKMGKFEFGALVCLNHCQQACFGFVISILSLFLCN